MSNTPTITNRKARHNYEIIDTYEAGMVLVGVEVKSLRRGEANLMGAYCKFKDHELFLVDCHITPYRAASTHTEVSATRPRKLLLSRPELRRLKAKVEEKGLTIIPLKIYFLKHLAKVLIGLGRGKREFDKRESLRRADHEMEMQRVKGRYEHEF